MQRVLNLCCVSRPCWYPYSSVNLGCYNRSSLMYACPYSSWGSKSSGLTARCILSNSRVAFSFMVVILYRRRSFSSFDAPRSQHGRCSTLVMCQRVEIPKVSSTLTLGLIWPDDVTGSRAVFRCLCSLSVGVRISLGP